MTSIGRRGIQLTIAMVLVTALLLTLTMAALATHTAGFRNGAVNCYQQATLYSTASNFVEHSWKNGGYNIWWNATNQRREHSIPASTWWAIDYDHQILSGGAYCSGT